MPDTPATAVRAIIVSDGKRGHENQSRVIARMLGVEEPLLMYLRPQYKDGGWTELLLRLRLRLSGPRSISRRAAGELVRTMLKPETPEAFRELAEEIAASAGAGIDLPIAGQKARQDAPLQAPLLLFSISTGTPPATLNLVLARLLGARSIVSMTPSLLPLSLFSAAILPDHDLSPGFSMQPNTLVTPLALSMHDSAAAQLQASALASEYGLEREQRYIGIAIGGPSKNSQWNDSHVRRWLEDVRSAALASGSQLLVTNSRRTPAETSRWLAELAREKAFAAFIDAASDPRNPLPAFYELCWQMHVSADSISMLSEAVQAGHRPVVHWTSREGPKGKLRRFIDNLSSGGDVFANARSLPTDSLRRRERVNANYSKLRGQLLELLKLD
ncbi:mitochondrial fission ELM1 family protein [bacterium]|nr:mitochondrial fission ELM1 family protein [bacterium]